MYSPVSSHIVLVIAAAALFYAAWTDLRDFKIRNELILVLAGLFVVHAVLSGRWVNIHWNVAVAFVMFLIMLAFYVQNWMGGGDIKLLTVSFLWVGYSCALPFAILLLLFASIYGIAAIMGWVKVQGEIRKRIPFAPSIAAALIGTFMLGCLHPV